MERLDADASEVSPFTVLPNEPDTLFLKPSPPKAVVRLPPMNEMPGSTMLAPQEGDPTNKSPRDLTVLSDEEALELLTSNRTVAEGYQRMCATRLEEYKCLMEKAFNKRLAELEEHLRTWKLNVDGMLSNTASTGGQPTKLTNEQKQLFAGNQALVAGYQSDPCPIVISMDWHANASSNPGPKPAPQSIPSNPESATGPNLCLTKEEFQDVNQHLMTKKTKDGLSLRLFSRNAEHFRGLVLRRGQGPFSPLAGYEYGQAYRASHFRPNTVIFEPTYKNIRTIWHIHKRLKQRYNELVALSKRQTGYIQSCEPDVFGSTKSTFDALLPADKSPIQMTIIDLSLIQPKNKKCSASDINSLWSEVRKNVLLARTSTYGDTTFVEYRSLDTYQLTQASGDDIVVWETFGSYRTMYNILDTLLAEEQSNVVDAYRALTREHSLKKRAPAETSSTSHDDRDDPNANTKATKVLRIVQANSQPDKIPAQSKDDKPKGKTPFKEDQALKAADPSKKKQIPKISTTSLQKNNNCIVTRSGTSYQRPAISEGSDEESNEYKVTKQLGKRSRSSGGSKAPPAKRARIEKPTAALHLESTANDVEMRGLFGASNPKDNNVECGSDKYGSKATTTNDQGGTTFLECQTSPDEQPLTQSDPKLIDRGKISPDDRSRALECMKQASDAIIREQIARGTNGDLAHIRQHHEQVLGGKDAETAPKAQSPICSTKPQAQPLAQEPDSPPQGQSRSSKNGEGLSPLSLTLQRVSDALQQSRSSKSQATAPEPSNTEQRGTRDERPTLTCKGLRKMFAKARRKAT